MRNNAVIQRLDPMFVDMQQSSAELTSLRRALRAGEIAAGSTTARLQLEDGSTYGVPGTVEFSEVAVDVSTGTVALRALRPGWGRQYCPTPIMTPIRAT